MDDSTAKFVRESSIAAEHGVGIVQSDGPGLARASRLRLSSAVDESMATPAAISYRSAYQRHRQGAAFGALGEAPAEDSLSRRSLDGVTTGSETESPAISPTVRRQSSSSGGVYGRAEHYRVEADFGALMVWRMDYQAHRAGAAKGSRGEVGAGLSIAAVRMLPVARQAAHLRQLARLTEAKARDSAVEATAQAPAVHVHVGAGRLGLGLVLPALAAGAKEHGGGLVVLQRPSATWAPIQHGCLVAFTVNGETTCTLRAVRAEGAAVRPLLAEGGAGGYDGLLLLTLDDASLDSVAACATSVSSSLGPALQKGIEPLVAALGRADPARLGGGTLRLYAAENDHAAVEKLGARDEYRALRLLPLLVDRVCTACDVSESEVATRAEPWQGEIVLMTPPDTTPRPRTGLRLVLARPPFAGPTIRLPESDAEAHFLHRRKILTVNGTHTTLAFLTLALHEPPPHTGLPAGDYELLRAVSDGDGGGGDEDDDEVLRVEETHRMVWSWCVARQLLLLFEFPSEVARAALGCPPDEGDASDRSLADALLAGARIAIDRLGRGGDTTKRVLGGGVVNRFETRLKPIATFLDTSCASSKWLRGRLAKTVLRRAKLTETAVRLSVLGLVADAERFAVPADGAGAGKKL